MALTTQKGLGKDGDRYLTKIPKTYLQNLREITKLSDKAGWNYSQLFDYLRSQYSVNSKYALTKEQAIELCNYLRQQIELEPKRKTKL